MAIKFKVRFRVGNRLGKASIYSLRDICVSLADTYSLGDAELEKILFMALGQHFTNEDMEVRRTK